MEISLLIDLLRSSRSRRRIRKERHNSRNLLSARFLHTRDSKQQLHDPIINILILERFYDEDIMPSDHIEELD